MPVKNNLKEYLEDDKLDLSMLGLTDVPVKDIAAIPKATSLDLSNNSLTTVGKNFATSLSYLVHLDLARNQIVELPENIGLLVNLKHLDLYSNQLTSLPLSFGNLKNLKWLDLKQNQLMPKLAQIVGPCLDSAQCGSAAKNVVELLAMMNKQVEVEKQRRQEQRQKQLEENERKAQELKKEQQQQKKKNKKLRKDELKSELANNGDVTENKMCLDENGFGDGKLNNDEQIDHSASETDIVADSCEKRRPSRVLNFVGMVFKTIVITSLLVGLILFVLNLIDEEYYKTARRHLIKARNQVSSLLPKPLTKKLAGSYVVCRKYVWRSANHFGKMSKALVHNVQDAYTWMNTNETIQLYYEQVKSGWQVLWIRISEIYRTYVIRAN